MTLLNDRQNTNKRDINESKRYTNKRDIHEDKQYAYKCDNNVRQTIKERR